MSDSPPPPPAEPPSGFGPPPGYGPPAGYGPPPAGHGAPPPPIPYEIGSPFGAYASWATRVLCYLWDLLYLWPGWVLSLLGYVLIIAAAASSDQGDDPNAGLLAVGIVVLLVGIAVGLWRLIRNYMIDQGRTGYTYGRRKLGVRLIGEHTGQPAGIGSCVARYFLHALINQACYIDYLWPLWDPKKQTLTDKILTTIVVHQPPPAA